MARSALAWDSPHPGELIRRARLARGWSQSVVARKMAAVRASQGETISVASLKSQLSRWENGKVTLDRFNMGVIAEMFSTTVTRCSVWVWLPVRESLRIRFPWSGS